jgi:ABC-type polar amino acid transport system ATPase subunit
MILSVDSISKSFGSKTVLKDVSFRIDGGSVFALCGASGTGKTTLVRILAGLTGFDSGKLVLHGTSIASDMPYPRSLYGQVGVVFQDHNLFPHMTALANVTLALRRGKKLPRETAEERGQRELARVGLRDHAHRYPASLSGGEKQRVAIARALALDPLLLLLDEPTSGLDRHLMVEVLRSIRDLAKGGTTMLLITHNLEFAAKTASRFGVLEDARLTASDEPGLLDRLQAEFDA